MKIKKAQKPISTGTLKKLSVLSFVLGCGLNLFTQWVESKNLTATIQEEVAKQLTPKN